MADAVDPMVAALQGQQAPPIPPDEWAAILAGKNPWDALPKDAAGRPVVRITPKPKPPVDPVITPDTSGTYPQWMQNVGEGIVGTAGQMAKDIGTIPQHFIEASEGLRTMGMDPNQVGDSGTQTYNPEPAATSMLLAAGLGPEAAAEGSVGALGGKLARTANLKQLSIAERMAANGEHPINIWQTTGWFQGMDGHWRFEIPDTGLKINPSSPQDRQWLRRMDESSSQIKHPAALGAYPELGDLYHKIEVDPAARPNDYGGEYWPPPDPTIAPGLNAWGQTPAAARSATAHELQHAIQDIEGFQQGIHPDTMAQALMQGKASPYWPYLEPHIVGPEGKVLGSRIPSPMELYARNAGEVEARTVQNRLKLPPEMLNQIPPWFSADMLPSKQIVIPNKIRGLAAKSEGEVPKSGSTLYSGGPGRRDVAATAGAAEARSISPEEAARAAEPLPAQEPETFAVPATVDPRDNPLSEQQFRNIYTDAWQHGEDPEAAVYRYARNFPGHLPAFSKWWEETRPQLSNDMLRNYGHWLPDHNEKPALTWRDPQAQKLFKERISTPLKLNEKQFMNHFFAGMHDPENFRGRTFMGSSKNLLGFIGNLQSKGKQIGDISRRINFDENNATHIGLKFDQEEQAKGFGKALLRNQINTYKKLGLDHVKLTAGDDLGGYAWAKYGFTPNQDDWPWLKKRIWKRLDGLVNSGLDPETANDVATILRSENPKAIWNISDLKRDVTDLIYKGYQPLFELYGVEGPVSLGKALLANQVWTGTLKLKDPKAMERFDGYVTGSRNK